MQTEKTLVITGTNITKRKIVYFNHQSHPNVKIIDAIQASINIPYYFTKYNIDGDYYIDGGVLDNFPLYYFDKYNEQEGILCKDSRHLNSEFGKVRGIESGCKKTLGILTLDVDYNEKNEFIGKVNVSSTLYEYTIATIHTLLHNTEVQKMRSDYWERIIAIKLPYDIESTNFSPQQKVIDDLLGCGYNEAKEYCQVIGLEESDIETMRL
jgi:predicted acylesterase/phospholipase RssA